MDIGEEIMSDNSIDMLMELSTLQEEEEEEGEGEGGEERVERETQQQVKHTPRRGGASDAGSFSEKKMRENVESLQLEIMEWTDKFIQGFIFLVILATLLRRPPSSSSPSHPAYHHHHQFLIDSIPLSLFPSIHPFIQHSIHQSTHSIDSSSAKTLKP